jgi:UDP-2-acetamido-2-deoxy-ribo-hexuluronate aminotransferase
MTNAGTQAQTRSVPFFSCARSFERQWPRLQPILQDVIERGRYCQGIAIEWFESAMRKYTSARFAVAVGNGTDALILLLRAAGVRPGDEVIVPCFTFVASASSIAQAGGTPVFVDIDPRTYTFDTERIASCMTPRTRAIMPVHLFAQMADMTPLQELARETGTVILEDSAEAIGMRWNGRHAGLLGAGGVLSFFPTKTLGAIGDAGMILTDDPEIAQRAFALRGVDGADAFCGAGSRMDEIQAAVLLTRLAELDKDIERRTRLARIYDDRLATLHPRVTTPVIERRSVETNPVYYVYVIESEDKPGLASYLAANGVGTEDYYPKPLHLQECFAHLGYKLGDFPNAERACTRTLALPLYPDMSEDDAHYVCDLIDTFHRRIA